MNLGFALYYRLALCRDAALQERVLLHLRGLGLDKRRDDQWAAHFSPRRKQTFASASLNLGTQAMAWDGPFPFTAYGWVADGGDAQVAWVRALAALLSPACGVLCPWPTRDQVISDASLVNVNDALPEPFASQRNQVMTRRHLIGERARHPRWGTFLHASLVERIGGRARLAPLAALVEQDGELVYLQLTASPADEHEEKRRALETAMAPILF